MKTLLLTCLYATLLFLLSCHSEDEPQRISYTIAQELAQALNLMQQNLLEADRVVAGEFTDCPNDTFVQSFVNVQYITVYSMLYNNGCLLPNGITAKGNLQVNIYRDSPVDDQYLREIYIHQFILNGLVFNGSLSTRKQTETTWISDINGNLMQDTVKKIYIEDFSTLQLLEGNDTPTTTDDVWSMSVDSMLITHPVTGLRTYASTESGSPLIFAPDCAHIKSGTVNINNGEAYLRFGQDACDNTFWLEWNSGASVKVTY